eukprot:scaffold54188_cov76-Phaeocystis_antarctica.AAC.1
MDHMNPPHRTLLRLRRAFGCYACVLGALKTTQSALIAACGMRHALLRAGADTNSANSADNTGLMVACSMGHEARRFYRRTPIPTCMSNVEPCSVRVSECRAVSGQCRGSVGAVSGQCRGSVG